MKQSLLNLLRTVGLCSVALAWCSGLSADVVTQPNIIVIFTDDMGYGDLSAYGSPNIHTPHLDQMAREGMKLTSFYTASSVCSPSRASLLTGRLPKRCGVNQVYWPNSRDGMPKEEVTVAEILQAGGYMTACIGKWHLGHAEGYLPTDRGFDSFYGLPYSHDMWIDPEQKLADDIQLNEGVTVEEIRADKYAKRIPHYMPMLRGDEAVEFPVDMTQLSNQFTAECVDFIGQQERAEKPFFLFYTPCFPHTPLYVSDEFKGKSARGLYGDVMAELDASVGQVLQALKDNGLDENTLVIFSSDNGPSLAHLERGGSSGPLTGGKFSTWEGGHRVPCLVRWPGVVPAGLVDTQMVSALDLMPTFLEYAGLELPTDRVLDGHSLVQYFEGNQPSPRSEMFFYRGGVLRATRVGSWKLHYSMVVNPLEHEFTDLEQPSLFNVDQDPAEQLNRSQNTQAKTKIQAAVDQHMKSL